METQIKNERFADFTTILQPSLKIEVISWHNNCVNPFPGHEFHHAQTSHATVGALADLKQARTFRISTCAT
jgi:hypothetical protein